MERIDVNPPVELERRPEDLELTPDQIRQLGFFQMIKQPKRFLTPFEEHPGAVRLRYFRRGDMILRQGDAGYTAFYILTTEDLLRLRQDQWQAAQDENSKHALAQEIQELQRRVDQGAAPPGAAATVYLEVAPEPELAQPTKPSLWEWITGKRSPSPVPATASVLVFVPFDGPADIAYQSPEPADMYEGELFGEASCLDGIPRSATVVAAREGYILEMLRNVLFDLQKDEGYRQYWDRIYRKRGLGIHLRRFSLFRALSDEAFETVFQQFLADLDSAEEDKLVTLMHCKHGEVICDEHDLSDSMYVIRSGLVQVVKHVSPLLGPNDVADWAQLGRALVEGGAVAEDPKGLVWQQLHAVHDDLRAAANGTTPDEAQRQSIVNALNALLSDGHWYNPAVFQAVVRSSADLAVEAKAVPKDRQTWPLAKARRFNRMLVEALYPDVLPTSWRSTATPLILAYRARGEIIGEMRLLRKQPRIATCVAYLHQESRREAVDLLRIGAEAFWRMVTPGSPLEQALQQIVREREQETEALEAAARVPESAQPYAPAFNALTLVQGRQLMLIDLDRCTRCDECVRACVATHADGRSRLFLDGPRYEHQVGSRLKTYLVPTTCRSCLNPECMMSCPVGSIHRGRKGEIVIENWCIGCQRCALFCPYGAIQMHDIRLIPESTSGWRYRPVRAGVMARWYEPNQADDSWLAGRTPFHCGAALPAGAAASGTAADPHVCFRYAFSLERDQFQTVSQFQLKVVTIDAMARVWINGCPVIGPPEPASADARGRASEGPTPSPRLPVARQQVSPPKGPWETRVVLPAEHFRPGNNVVAVSATPTALDKDILLDLGLYTVHRMTAWASADVQFLPALVAKKAVVCDLCQSLPGGPACVKACPHEAAVRFEARAGIPAW